MMRKPRVAQEILIREVVADNVKGPLNRSTFNPLLTAKEKPMPYLKVGEENAYNQCGPDQRRPACVL